MTKAKWLRQRKEFICRDMKTRQIPREDIFAKQGLTKTEIHERWLIDTQWGDNSRN